MKRIFSFAILLTSLFLAFQNCTQSVNMNGEGLSDQPALGSGNAGGYGGKVFVLPAMPGDCSVNEKIKERLVLPDSGDAELVVENCRAITPIKVPRSELTISNRSPELLDYRGRAFVDEIRFKPRLSCSYTSTSTTAVIDETLLVGETSSGLVAVAHRYEKSTGTRRALLTQNHAVSSALSTTNPQLFSITSALINLNLLNINVAAYAAGQDVQADITYQLTFTDMITGVDEPLVNGSYPRNTCTVLK